MALERVAIGKFNVSSFGGVVLLQCDIEFAVELYKLIRLSQTENMSLFAVTDKLKREFFRMNKLDLLVDDD